MPDAVFNETGRPRPATPADRALDGSRGGWMGENTVFFGPARHAAMARENRRTTPTGAAA
ncbi:hypothetical protein BI344_04335 [Chromobacterium sphagni]|uniref:Uncharacterized protein n=1 Tax=Chromobacterium sphagni TaxID=1903179 RepID=A0ABX3CHV1_9NEIS|nr:hypothetical protein BI344_04335 [Chromobacterium sphagni]